MNITITGASGFVGQNLSRHLRDARYSVRGQSLRSPRWMNQVLDSEAIIHLAGKAHDTKNTSEESEYFEVNTELTKDLFDIFLASDAHTFIHFSSVKAVADEVNGVLEENVQAQPETAYGKSKLEAEQYLLSHDLPQGKRMYIIRPCMIHGPGNKGNLNLLYSVVKKGIPWPLAAYHNERSYLSIDNLNYLIEKIIETPTLPSGVYNFADDDFVSTNELIEIISACNGKNARLWPITPKLIGGMAKLGDKLHLPLNTERLQKLTESYKVSNAKIKSALGIDKLPTTAAEGLIKTIRSFGE